SRTGYLISANACSILVWAFLAASSGDLLETTTSWTISARIRFWDTAESWVSSLALGVAGVQSGLELSIAAGKLLKYGRSCQNFALVRSLKTGYQRPPTFS